MNLQFTGIGAAYYPQLGSNAAFFAHNEHLFMLDCGETTFQKMIVRSEIYECERITVLITHLHADHIGSLGSFVSYCKNILSKTVTVAAPDDSITRVLALTGVQRELYEFTTDLKTVWEDGLSIISQPVHHADDLNCRGFIISDEEETIYYSGDASGFPSNIMERFLCGDISRVYHECTFLNKETDSHTTLDKLCAWFPPSERHRVYCMHLGGEYQEWIESCGFQVVQPI